MKNSFKTLFYVLFAIAALLIASFWFKGYSYTWGANKIYVYNNDTNNINSKDGNEDIRCRYTEKQKIQFIEELRQRGQLFTPDEFASRITNYYNSLIAFLATLLGIIAFIQWVTVNKNFKKEFDEKRKEIDEKLQTDIEKKLQNMLQVSIHTKEIIMGALRKNAQEDFVPREEFEALSNESETMQNHIKDIITKIESMDETISSHLNITDTNTMKNGNQGS